MYFMDDERLREYERFMQHTPHYRPRGCGVIGIRIMDTKPPPAPYEERMGQMAAHTLSMIDGKCYLSFRDGQGVPHRLELDVKLYAVFDRFELDDLSFLNEQERHLDWTELNEELLSRRSAQEPAPVEDAVYESMQTQALREGVNQLPEVQKRRLQMYFFDGLTHEEIAVREGCSYQAVQKSIAAALKKIRKFLK